MPPPLIRRAPVGASLLECSSVSCRFSCIAISSRTRPVARVRRARLWSAVIRVRVQVTSSGRMSPRPGLLYSALGIDYTTVRHDDPLGRGFEYVPFAKDGTYKPIEELW